MKQAILKLHIALTVYIVLSSDQMREVQKILSLLIMVYKNHKIRYFACLWQLALK